MVNPVFEVVVMLVSLFDSEVAAFVSPIGEAKLNSKDELKLYIVM